MHPDLQGTLMERGCSEIQAGRLAGRFRALGDGDVRLFVPGRVELLGKHTDYAGGSSITMATGHGFCAVAKPLDEAVLRIVDATRKLTAELPLKTSLMGDGWTTYPAAVIRRVLSNLPSASKGAEIVLESDLPRAAGMSSSSALITCVFLAWAQATGWIDDPLLQEALTSDQDLADYLASIENGGDFKSLKGRRGVGTKGGSQDHTAIIRGKSGHIRRFQYARSELEATWEWSADHSVIVLASGVNAKKTGDAQAAYNAASELAAGLRTVWNSLGSPVAAIGLLDGDQLNELGKMVNGVLLKRLNAFCQEIAAVEAASWALDNQDTEAFAHAIDASQAAAESLLGNQVPETSYLCEAAKECGALTATSFGAGFGGSVWALVPAGDEAAVIGATLAQFRKRFSSPARGFAEEQGPGAFILDGRSLF